MAVFKVFNSFYFNFEATLLNFFFMRLFLRSLQHKAGG